MLDRNGLTWPFESYINSEVIADSLHQKFPCCLKNDLFWPFSQLDAVRDKNGL